MTKKLVAGCQRRYMQACTCRCEGALAAREVTRRIALQLTWAGVAVRQMTDAAAVEMGEPAAAGAGGGEVDTDVV